jgi:glycogen operon protein
MSLAYDRSAGQSYPLGATAYPDGVNFCLFSKHADAVELLLFDEPNAPQAAQIIALDPRVNKTFHYWHIFIQGLKAGQVYAFRVDGPFAPERGYYFDKNKVLLDPYAKAIAGDEIYDRQAASRPGDNCAQALRGVVVDAAAYDWEGDQPLQRPYSESIIYELHVGGFTRHPSSELPPEKRGTYAGLIEKIPYFQDLGITAVELLPIHHFDPQDAPPGLKNYWGYSTVGFFAPHRGYSSRRDRLGAVDEFRDMVKALHCAGIEVILDVVFNHTAEGNETGPTLSWRGLANDVYYILEEDRAHYKNYSGCGNTLRTTHPIVGKMVLDCLRYWVTEMHVDGFRFDLASVLSRSFSGQAPLQATSPETVEHPGILWAIESDPVLAGTKLIAEAWDGAGLYQLGWFVNLGERFAEWNGRFRDDVRHFVRGDSGTVPRLASRLLGSPDIYSRPDYETYRSINFVTCHDGFTLNDLVSYNAKHNEANGEDNRDGMNDNVSWNCGEEGENDNPEFETLRLRQIKNFLTILFMSQGTPMLLMGDGVRRSQQGNNNAYCQDNELSWFDWRGLDRHWDLWCFARKLIDFTQHLEIFRQKDLLTVTAGSHKPHLIWHGVELGAPDWSYDSHSLAFSLRHPEQQEYLHVMLNAYWQPLAFELPLLGHQECWHRVIDTALSLPVSFCDLNEAPPVNTERYLVEARSCAVLIVKSR